MNDLSRLEQSIEEIKPYARKIRLEIYTQTKRMREAVKATMDEAGDAIGEGASARAEAAHLIQLLDEIDANAMKMSLGAYTLGAAIAFDAENRGRKVSNNEDN